MLHIMQNRNAHKLAHHQHSNCYITARACSSAQTLASESGSKVSGEANAHIAHARIGTARRARANNYVRRVTIHGRPGTAREPVTGEH